MTLLPSLLNISVSIEITFIASLLRKLDIRCITNQQRPLFATVGVTSGVQLGFVPAATTGPKSFSHPITPNTCRS